MNDIDDILNGPDYFYCEKFKSKMRKVTCLERQQKVRSSYSFSDLGITYDNCKKCKQGKTIRDEIMIDDPNPIEGPGERYPECLFYNDCLDGADHMGWKSFNCDQCGYRDQNFLEKVKKPEKGANDYSTGPEEIFDNPIQDKDEMPTVKEENKEPRKCKTPGCNNETPHPNFPYCHSCLDERKKKKIRGKDEVKKEKGERIKGSQSACAGKAMYPMPNKDNAAPEGNTALVIEFGRHTEILDTIREIADEELRPVDMQIIYMLKKQLQEERAQK